MGDENIHIFLLVKAYGFRTYTFAITDHLVIKTEHTGYTEHEVRFNCF